MRVLTLILFVLLILLQFKLWFGEGGFREVARLEARVENQQNQNEDLLQRNAELQAEVEDLRERLDAVEERARNELGLIKPAEEFYQVVPSPPETQQNQQAGNDQEGEGI
jgi:cell division protein FtsB